MKVTYFELPSGGDGSIFFMFLQAVSLTSGAIRSFYFYFKFIPFLHTCCLLTSAVSVARSFESPLRTALGSGFHCTQLWALGICFNFF